MAAGESDSVERAFFGDLRRLGDLYRTQLSVALPLRPLARSIGVSPTTVGEWLKGSRFPQQPEAFAGMIERLRQGFDEHRIEVPPAEARLLDSPRWRTRHQAVARSRAEPVRAGVQRAQAAAVLTETEARTRSAALADKPRPVGHWSARQLGVHPAIAGTHTQDRGAGFLLPRYVEREHDRLLRARLDAAATGRECALVIVRGESCTGKTRTAFEAVRSCLADWQLVFPKSADDLLALLAADALAPRTVLWLNEAQDYFLAGPSGEAAAAGLRRRLEGPGPAVILATLWPVHHRLLTATGSSGAGHPHARALLGPVSPVDVPDSFGEQALRDLREQAAGDGALAAADRTSPSGTITQTLAAGPALVDHYESAARPDGPYGKAIITAAMDARRLGHSSPLPAELLRAAAPGYLTEEQRAAADPETWFAHALSYARTKVKDVVAALGEVANPSGMGSVPDVYRLADYLDHHARTTRRYEFPPESFWAAAREHAASPSDLRALARAARERGRLRTAVALYRQGADAGDLEALTELAGLYEEAGHPDAGTLYRRAAEEGHPHAVVVLAEKLQNEGDQDGAEQLAWQLAADGDPSALMRLVDRQAWALGDPKGAERLARRAAAGGYPDAFTHVAHSLMMAQDDEGAEELLRQAVDAGHSAALLSLGNLRELNKDFEGAEQVYQEAFHAGHTTVRINLARLREQAGDRAGAERLLQQAIEDGDRYASRELACVRERAGDREGAERLAREYAAQDDADGLMALAELREEAGEPEEAERLAVESATRDLGYGLVLLARGREQTEGSPGAERLYRRAAAAGNSVALLCLVWYRERAGDLAGAEQLARRYADTGRPMGLVTAGELRFRAGDRRGAETAIRQAVNAACHPAGTAALATLYEKAGEAATAERLRRYGLEADGTVAAPWDL